MIVAEVVVLAPVLLRPLARREEPKGNLSRTARVAMIRVCGPRPARWTIPFGGERIPDWAESAEDSDDRLSTR
jgi:hypothetical protein